MKKHSLTLRKTHSAPCFTYKKRRMQLTAIRATGREGFASLAKSPLIVSVRVAHLLSCLSFVFFSVAWHNNNKYRLPAATCSCLFSYLLLARVTAVTSGLCGDVWWWAQLHDANRRHYRARHRSVMHQNSTSFTSCPPSLSIVYPLN